MAEMLVCRDGEMAEGGVRIVRAGKFEIGVIRHEGKYYAYRNYCPHQGGPACEGLRMPQVKELVDENGVFHGKTFDETDMHIVCPWHGYEFHLSDGYHVADRRLRLLLNGSTSDNTLTSRLHRRYWGAGLQHASFRTEDIFATAATFERLGLTCVHHELPPARDELPGERQPESAGGAGHDALHAHTSAGWPWRATRRS